MLRVQTAQRAQEIVDLCAEHDLCYVLGVESSEPEDLSDLERALNPPEPVRAALKPGRNDPCPCGSGLKTKKCCPELAA
jgi:SWIM/SEC-C metal-binding protein